jgi:hypothetical protein
LIANNLMVPHSKTINVADDAMRQGAALYAKAN